MEKHHYTSSIYSKAVPEQMKVGATAMNTSRLSKKYYEEASELVEKVKIRNKFLEDFKLELSDLLQKFSHKVFKKYPKTSGFIFSGMLDNKLKVGTSKCDNLDYFVDVIGKLIAVRRSLNMEVESIENFLQIYGNVLHI